jgi:hypothetical protein
LAHFGHAAIAELSPVSGIRRKLDFEPAKRSFWRKAAVRRDQHVAEGPTPDMQRRIVDRVEPKTLFPFGAPGEGPRACGTIRWASPVIDTGSRFWFSPHSVG